MTFKVIIYFMKNLRLHNVSIHNFFYQNRLINEYVRKKKAKISESRSFLVRYRRTYVLNNIIKRPLKIRWQNTPNKLTAAFSLPVVLLLATKNKLMMFQGQRRRIKKSCFKIKTR